MYSFNAMNIILKRLIMLHIFYISEIEYIIQRAISLAIERMRWKGCLRTLGGELELYTNLYTLSIAYSVIAIIALLAWHQTCNTTKVLHIHPRYKDVSPERVLY